MPKALEFECPRWMHDGGTPDEPNDPRYVWPGRMRVVSARRARKLRKRGVPLLPLHRVLDRSGGEHRPGHVEPTTPNDRARYCWFEPERAVDTRRWRRAVTCYQTGLDANHGLRGRKCELASRLYSQRARAQAYVWRLRYMVRVATPDERAQRMSPLVTVFLPLGPAYDTSQPFVIA